MKNEKRSYNAENADVNAAKIVAVKNEKRSYNKLPAAVAQRRIVAVKNEKRSLYLRPIAGHHQKIQFAQCFRRIFDKIEKMCLYRKFKGLVRLTGLFCMSKLKNANLEQRLAIKAERNRLPCLNRNNSISKVKPTETEQQKQKKETQEKKFKEISTAHKKSAFALEQNVKAFIEHFGLNHCGFLTLTFADNVQDPKEAQRRFNSLRTNFLKKHYPHYIRVIERTKSGRIHYHLIVACKEDIRRGLNFQAIERKDYRTANNDIKRHWKRLRENLPKYGFGRAELLPVKTNSKGLAAYISKYIGKHINQRTAADKSVRLCQTSIDKTHKWKIANSHFQFLSKGSKDWRKKLAAWVENLNNYMKTTKPYSSITNQPYTEITAENWNTRIKQVLKTEKWAFFNLNTILNTPIAA